MEQSSDARPIPVKPRPAATIIVARSAVRSGGPSRLEFLVLRRSRVSRFAPGFVVFPGGVIDPGDAVLGERWFGGDDPGQAARACALRELAEETGLVMTSEGLVAAPGRLPGEPSLPPPAMSQVPEIARWVAPEFLPARFDARFFAIAAGPGLDPTPDGMEIEAAWWRTAPDVLAGTQSGDVQLLWPTYRTLEALTSCRSIEDVLSLRVEAVPPPIAITSASRAAPVDLRKAER